MEQDLAGGEAHEVQVRGQLLAVLLVQELQERDLRQQLRVGRVLGRIAHRDLRFRPILRESGYHPRQTPRR